MSIKINKTIGIISAMNCELSGMVNALTDLKESNVANMKIWQGKLNELNVVIALCGIGKVNAAIAAQILITQFQVDSLINIGLAGALAEAVNIGDVVISNEVTYFDYDARQLRNNFPYMESTFFKADTHLIDVCKRASISSEYNGNVHVGRIISGDRFIKDNETREKLVTQYNGLCTEMEGASIGHVAHVFGTPFVVIRIMSDKANQEASISFAEYCKLSPGIIQTLMVEVADTLQSMALVL